MLLSHSSALSFQKYKLRRGRIASWTNCVVDQFLVDKLLMDELRHDQLLMDESHHPQLSRTARGIFKIDAPLYHPSSYQNFSKVKSNGVVQWTRYHDNWAQDNWARRQLGAKVGTTGRGDNWAQKGQLGAMNGQ